MFVMSIIFVQAEEGVIYKTWTEMSQLEGTLLWRLDISTSPQGSDDATRSCTIGYMIEDKGQESFVPVLILPTLDRDVYVIAVVDGVLKITAKKASKMILSLNLRNFQPIALTR